MNGELPAPDFPGRLRLLRAGLSQPWRAWRARRAVRRAAAGLAAARAALEQFDTGTSREFIALADGLTAFDQQLAVIREQAAKLGSTLEDHDEDRALSSAFELYKKSVDLAHSSIGIALSQEEEMEHMEGGLLSQHAAFNRTNLMFRVLVMNLRTEAARIDPEQRAVFMSVAGEMEEMERHMTGTLETAFTQLEAIIADATDGRQKLQQLRDQLHQGAQQSVQLLRAEFDGVAARLQPCIAASREITRLLDVTAGHFGTLITSLQFQDIVRQQLDHVGEGLTDIAQHLGSETRLDLGYLAQAVRVQQFNLASSRDAIASAAAGITGAGGEVTRTGAELATVFDRMEKEAEKILRGSRLGELFQTETAKLVATADQSEATNERITQLLARIGQIVGVFSSELLRQELDVHLVALNAQVAAARLPEARALNKLAESTADLSRESATLSRAMGAKLGATLDRLNAMSREADEVRQTIGLEKAELAQGTVTVAAKLARFNERVNRTSAAVAKDFSAAYGNLEALLGALQFPAAIETSFAPATELCAGLAAAAGGFAPADHHAALAGHHERYTMRQEREAHAAALGRSLAAEDDPTVELFTGTPPAGPAAEAIPAPVAEPVPVAPGGDIELF